MGSITIPTYGHGHPKNEDYAYDLARQRKVDMEQDSVNAPAEIYTNVRRKAFSEVAEIIGTLSVRKPPMQVINELIALCRKEVK